MRRFIYLAIAGVVLLGCEQQNSFSLVSSEGKTAESVYLTHDHKNNPVIVWTERDNNDLTLFFATSHDNGKSFAEKISLLVGSDVATHAESMPKVAFKKNGTIIAAYEKKTPTKENKYAGAIYYVASTDAGKSWTKESFLHSDTVAGRSRSYFDIEQLADGEIGASWLDIKLNNETGGRSVRFAKTVDGQRFGNEILVDSSACQCCRIDVYGDIAGRVNVAYRGLMKGSMGQSIRDMMLATSMDNGKTFTTPARISQDNWAIEGCPHTGPSLCSNKSGLFSFWYTEGNGTGIYYSFKQNANARFEQKQLVSNSGLHPQLSASDTRFIMVWEENVDQDEKKFTRVFYQVSNTKGVMKNHLTPKNANAFLPVATQTDDGFLVAFLMSTGDNVGVYVTSLD
jgi:hypothetical protein